MGTGRVIIIGGGVGGLTAGTCTNPLSGRGCALAALPTDHDEDPVPATTSDRAAS